MTMRVESWLVEHLGERVALAVSVGKYPAGSVGLLVSLQAGKEPGAKGPYATVGFDPDDWWDETNVPLSALRPLEAS